MEAKNSTKKSALSFLQNSKTEDKIVGSKSIIEDGEKEIKDISDSKSIPQTASKKTAMKRKNIAANKTLCSFEIDSDVHKLLKMHSSFTGIAMNYTVEEQLKKFFKSNKTFKDDLKKFMQE